MKIAVCLSGHVRTFESTKSGLIDNILKKYDCDIFVSTWDNIGNIRYGTHYINGFDETDEKINVDRIEEIYKPKSILVENGLEYNSNNIKESFDNIKTRNGTNVKYVIPMFYKIWNCNNLKKEYEQKNNIKYDLTLRCRFDIYIKNINIEMAIKEVQCIPAHCGVQDFVFIGPNSAINYLCDIYTVMSSDISFIQFENVEQIWYTHLMNNNILFNSSYDGFDYARYTIDGIYDNKGNCIQKFSL